MPRPKKTNPTVATTEPDTNLNPDRAQVAAVADLPRESEPAPVTSVFRLEQVPTSGDSLRDYLRASAGPAVSPADVGEYFRLMSKADQVLANAFVERVCASEAKMVDPILAAKDERIALMDVERANHRKEIEMWMSAVQKVTAERDAAMESRPLTPADLIAGYRAVASGQVKAAEWKGRRLVRLHGNPEPIAMYDHPEPPPGCMPSGFVAEVASGTTRIMSPPLKDEAEARAWCEARCGWTVVQ